MQQCRRKRHYGLEIREIDVRRASDSSRSTGRLLVAAFRFLKTCLDEAPLSQSKHSIFENDQLVGNLLEKTPAARVEFRTSDKV